MLSLQSDPREYYHQQLQQHQQQLILQVPRVSHGVEDVFVYRMTAVESGGSSNGGFQIPLLVDQQRSYHSHEGLFFGFL